MQRILVPLDGSGLSERILGHVSACFESGAAVRLIRVATRSELDSAGKRNILGEERAYLADLVARLGQKKKLETSTAVLIGDPAEKILDEVKTWRPTLVAMATHGRTGVARLVRGSVAERVLRECPRPLLLVNVLSERRSTRIKKILVPLDGSMPAASILALVRWIGERNGSEVILFNVVPRGDQSPEGMATRSEAEGYLASVAGLLGKDVPTKLVTGQGEPAATILRAAAREKVDLVAMTTHGRSGVSRWVFGSVAENVLRACRCPILVRRTTTGED